MRLGFLGTVVTKICLSLFGCFCLKNLFIFIALLSVDCKLEDLFPESSDGSKRGNTSRMFEARMGKLFGPRDAQVPTVYLYLENFNI